MTRKRSQRAGPEDRETRHPLGKARQVCRQPGKPGGQTGPPVPGEEALWNQPKTGVKCSSSPKRMFCPQPERDAERCLGRALPRGAQCLCRPPQGRLTAGPQSRWRGWGTQRPLLRDEASVVRPPPPPVSFSNFRDKLSWDTIPLQPSL